MNKYLKYFLVSYHGASTYKADFILGMLTETVFFFLYFTLWKTIYTSGGISDINTYSLSNTITYYFVTSIIFKLDVSNSIYLGPQIWSGYFTNDLIKPWHVTIVSMLDTIAEKILVLLIYIPIILLIIASAREYITFPSPLYLLYFIITLIIGFGINLGFNYTIHALTFKYGDQDANIGFLNYIAVLLAGALFPLAFLPAKFKSIFEILPFKYLFDVPAKVFLEKLNQREIFINWLYGIIWIVVFFSIYKIIFNRGLRVYTGTGR